jgi:acyl-CoA-binding protein
MHTMTRRQACPCMPVCDDTPLDEQPSLCPCCLLLPRSAFLAAVRLQTAVASQGLPPCRSQARFNAAADAVALAVTGKHPAFTDALKLRFYGLYKQATVGPCTDKQPGIWNPAGRAKWWAFGRVGLLLAC